MRLPPRPIGYLMPTVRPTPSLAAADMLARLGMIEAPVRIEPTSDAALDEDRRAAVADLLAQAGVPAAEAMNRVVIGGTRSEGLRYRDIEGVYARSLGIYGSLGGGYGGFGSGFGGFGGFGGYGGHGGIIR
jgi:hypothetical protein